MLLLLLLLPFFLSTIICLGIPIFRTSTGKPRQMMLDWIMVEEYKKLKEEAQQQEESEEWRHQTLNQPRRQRTRRRREDHFFIHSIHLHRAPSRKLSSPASGIFRNGERGWKSSSRVQRHSSCGISKSQKLNDFLNLN